MCSSVPVFSPTAISTSIWTISLVTLLLFRSCCWLTPFCKPSHYSWTTKKKNLEGEQRKELCFLVQPPAHPLGNNRGNVLFFTRLLTDSCQNIDLGYVACLSRVLHKLLLTRIALPVLALFIEAGEEKESTGRRVEGRWKHKARR